MEEEIPPSTVHHLPSSTDWLIFRVSDTGIGMTEEQTADLFQPFTQMDTSTTRKHGGTGLGLALCYRLSQLLGGSISVQTEPHKGSTFTLRIPADVPDLKNQSETFLH